MRSFNLTCVDWQPRPVEVHHDFEPSAGFPRPAIIQVGMCASGLLVDVVYGYVRLQMAPPLRLLNHGC